MLSVERTDTDSIVFAIASGGSSEEPSRRWTIGPLTLSAGEGVCIVEALGCNWRDVIAQLDITWSGGARSLDPGDSAVIETGGQRYAIDAISLVHPTEAFDGPACGAVRFDRDKFRIVALHEVEAGACGMSSPDGRGTIVSGCSCSVPDAVLCCGGESFGVGYDCSAGSWFEFYDSPCSSFPEAGVDGGITARIDCDWLP